MPADDLASVWTSDPVRISQSIKHAGKELDREKEHQHPESETPEREHDSVELSSEEESETIPLIKVKDNHFKETDASPGANLDVTIG